jgi:uncharacterized membrane protein YcjF (UPF0283 family)
MTLEPDARHAGVPGRNLRPAGGHAGSPSAPSDSSTPELSAPRHSEAHESHSERRVGTPSQQRPTAAEAYDPETHGEDPADESKDDPSDLNDITIAWWREILFTPAVFSVIALIVAMVALVLVSEVFQFVQAVQSAPRSLQWVGYAVAIASVLLAGWAFARLLWCMTALQLTPQIRKSDYNTASARQFVRKRASRSSREGRDVLRVVLTGYPLEEKRFQALLKACGCTREAQDRLRSDISDLLSGDALPAESWLSRFDARVLAVVDECAIQRVHTYAIQTGVNTALMPTSMADVVIVVTNSLLMLKDLCALYNVRTTPLGTCSLAGRLFMTSFVAARLEGQLSSLAQEAERAVTASISPGDAVNAAGKILTTATMGVGRRVAEGVANYMLIRRLGDACIQHLRPIQR